MSTPSTPAPTRPPLADAVVAEIRAEIARQGLKPPAVAERIGVPVYWVTSRLNGTVRINLADLERIAAALDITALSLMDRAA